MLIIEDLYDRETQLGQEQFGGEVDEPETIIPVTPKMIENLVIGALCAFGSAALFAACFLCDNADLAWRAGR